MNVCLICTGRKQILPEDMVSQRGVPLRRATGSGYVPVNFHPFWYLYFARVGGDISHGRSLGMFENVELHF